MRGEIVSMENQASVKSDVVSLETDFATIQELHGFFTFEALKLFHAIAAVNPRKISSVLEIGVFCGRSLLGLASAFREAEVVGVDPFFSDFCQNQTNPDEAAALLQRSNNLLPDQRKTMFTRVVKKFEEENKIPLHIRLVELTQNDFFNKRNKNEKFQLIHIDAEHSYEAVQDCLDELESLLVPDSWIVVDDVLNPHFPEISEAIHTHRSYKEQIWPVFYGFNKAVYLYNPTQDTLVSQYASRLRGLYSDNSYGINVLHDHSLYVYKIPPKISQNRALGKIQRISRRVIRKLSWNR